jgi:hypothetical protein
MRMLQVDSLGTVRVIHESLYTYGTWSVRTLGQVTLVLAGGFRSPQ